MKVGVLGAGNIGGTLGKRWAQAGHTVQFGVRDVTDPKAQALVSGLGAQASVATLAEAIAFGDVVVFAIPGGAMEATIRTYGQALNGKIVIDAANRMGAPAMNSAAIFAAQAPGARVFRAFNTMGWENFVNPRFGDQQADLFYCGAGGDAQAAVEQLIADAGLRPIRVGDIAQASLVDMVTGLWFALANGQRMGRHLAFKVLTD